MHCYDSLSSQLIHNLRTICCYLSSHQSPISGTINSLQMTGTGGGGVGDCESGGYPQGLPLFFGVSQESFILCYIPKGKTRTRVLQTPSQSLGTSNKPPRQPTPQVETAPSANRRAGAPKPSRKTHPIDQNPHLQPPRVRNLAHISV